MSPLVYIDSRQNRMIRQPDTSLRPVNMNITNSPTSFIIPRRYLLGLDIARMFAYMRYEWYYLVIIQYYIFTLLC